VLDRALLPQVPIFGGLADDELDRVQALLVERRVGEGASVFREGEPGRELFVIASGRAAVSKRSRDGAEVYLCDLGPGACFGEMALIGITVRTATIVALTPLDLAALPYAAIARLSSERPGTFTMLVMNLAREICRRLQQSDARLIEAGLLGQRI
jgi:CRP-like cAMP-binding protein